MIIFSASVLHIVVIYFMVIFMPFYDGVALCLLTINKTKDRKREKKTTEKNCVFNVQLRDTPSYMCKFYCWLNSIQQTKEMTQESKKKRERKKRAKL